MTFFCQKLIFARTDLLRGVRNYQMSKREERTPINAFNTSSNLLVTLHCRFYPYYGHASPEQAMLSSYVRELAQLKKKETKTHKQIERMNWLNQVIQRYQ